MSLGGVLRKGRNGVAMLKAIARERIANLGTRWQRLRRRDLYELKPASTGPAAAPRQGDFDRDRALAAYRRGIEIEDRLYNYVLYPGEEGLCVHFSAFFGEWGDRKENRALYQGYFHRMRMFWPLRRYRFLFLCDTFGADANGTYYKGEGGDFFVERAMDEILDRVQQEAGVESSQVVMMGSSMGATAALRFALRRQAGGAIAVSPHIDLDLCARHQGRARHVAAVLGSEEVESPRYFPVTREIRDLAASAPLGPRIVMQSMEDDHGVHTEQVLPFDELWSGRGGELRRDYHATGGHTSEYATPEWFEQQLLWCLQR